MSYRSHCAQRRYARELRIVRRVTRLLRVAGASDVSIREIETLFWSRAFAGIEVVSL